ncbi:peptide/nickel transport system ATP-binding protein [Rhizobium aethiopicum]|uniref:Peptide/nickel transport system ATP-binding protein n=1 Tax=Rhizobium aethiopicum TaxID=1138170 RepID=A0A1C3Y2D6_9HYPH|nr:ABC transporter ATP-binding protein [Rhizobium aethiopicum]SCB58617.1 peptide/nickel transport system ATP-binding protein [Rhizobium aethiopicum]
MLDSPLIVKNLSMRDTEGRIIVDDASITVSEGEVLAIIGESGSGKTSLALGLLGFARPGMLISAGEVIIDNEDILSVSEQKLQSYRGSKVSLVPQNPTTSFSPRMRIGDQIAELLSVHGYSAAQTLALRRDMLENVGLPTDGGFLRRYPFELSGGQLQRIAIGMAFITRPRVIVMDEPTTGLDVSTQQTILNLIRELVQTSKASFVYVTHDLAVVHNIADSVAVMLGGKIIERGTKEQVFREPATDYTRTLLSTIPHLPDRCNVAEDDGASNRVLPAVLKIEDLSVSYGDVRVVHGISFSIDRGECLALVGGSGSGKTTTGRCIAGLHANGHGRMTFQNAALSFGYRNRSRAQLAALQIVFQNPDRSLNPRESIYNAVGRAARLAGADEGSMESKVTQLLDRVRLPRRVLTLYPPDLSGGERQRVAIARALAMNPHLLICDEITSALDVSVQAAVVDLLMELKRDGLSMLFITHNLPLVSEIAESIVIMKNGLVTECGSTTQVLRSPQDEYTRLLLEAAPRVQAQHLASRVVRFQS